MKRLKKNTFKEYATKKEKGEWEYGGTSSGPVFFV